MKQKGVAILLCLFLGGFGAHHFYLGRTLAGFLSLVFCWTFLPALFAIFEFFGLLFTSEESFNRKFNSKPQTQNASAALATLADLYSKNMLSKDEFEEKKARLLKQIG